MIFLEHYKQYVNAVEFLSGWTALHLACIGGFLDCVQLLRQYKASNRKKNRLNEVPSDCISYLPDSKPAQQLLHALL